MPIMKYYELSVSSEPKIIGVRNGVNQGKIKWKQFKSKSSEKKIIHFFLDKLGESLDKIEPIDFEIEYVEAYKTAKMTDFFIFTPALYGVNFLVSNKVVELLKRFHLPIHTYIPAQIYHKDILYQYYGLYIPQYYTKKALVIEKCVFNKGNNVKKEFITFKKLEDYLNYKENYLSAEKITFNKTVDTTLDLFQSIFFGYSFLISEKLKMAIEEAGVTGLVIQELKSPEIFFD